jgi:predicted DNA-binding antitoxin AbrB/MazE fold protein
MIRIKAVYENGVLRPLQPLNLQEGQIVWLTIILNEMVESGVEETTEASEQGTSSENLSGR